jgi:hypothetical protein
MSEKFLDKRHQRKTLPERNILQSQNSPDRSDPGIATAKTRARLKRVINPRWPVFDDLAEPDEDAIESGFPDDLLGRSPYLNETQKCEK